MSLKNTYDKPEVFLTSFLSYGVLMTSSLNGDTEGISHLPGNDSLNLDEFKDGLSYDL